MFNRIKTAVLAVCYSLRKKNPFTIRGGFLYFPSSAIVDEKQGVTKVKLNRENNLSK